MAEYLPPTENLPIFDSESFKDSNNEFLTYDKANKYFLKFPNAQGTENFNTLSANEITAPGDLLLTPEGSVDMNGKTLNMTNGEIHNCPLIHSKNNEDIVIEGKGTGKVILKTSNSNAVSVLPTKITLQKDLEVESSTTDVKVYNVNFKDLLDGTNNSNLYQFDNEFKFQNISNSGIIDFITNDAFGDQTTVLELSSTSAIVRSPLNMTNNAIINCPLIQASNDEDIVIEGKGSGNVILKNVTKIMEIQNHSIRCYQDLYMYQVDNNEPPPLLKAYQIFIQNLTPNGPQSTLFHNGLILKLENDSLGGSINLVTNDALGAQTTVLEASSTSVIMRKPILMNDALSSNRVITSSLLALNETTGSYSPTVLHHIYQTGGTANYINYVNNGTTNLTVVNSVGSIVTPLTITPTSNNIPPNINLAMAAGTGIINQGISNTGTSLSNIFKKSAIAINSGSSTGSSTSGLEIYDESGGGRGLFILPNSGGGSLSNLNMANDCALVSRSPQNNNSISITNWNSELRNGIRIFTTDINNCGLTIQCGNGIGSIFSELRMAFNKTLNTLTTSFNNPIDFNPTNLGAISPARRLLSGLGTLSFTDILGNTTGGTDTGTITNNSLATVPGMQYTSNLNTGSHNFIVSDASFKYNPFSVNFQNIKHNVPTALADFSIGSSLALAGGVIIGSSGINNINVNSNTNNRGIGNYTIPSRGTYIVIFNFKISTVSADTPFTNVSCGITSVQNVYNTAGQYSVGNNSVDNAFTLQHEGVNQYVSTCVLNIASPSTVIYFTYNLVFGTVAAVGIMNNYTITRIA
jgi:hypothetical protein